MYKIEFKNKTWYLYKIHVVLKSSNYESDTYFFSTSSTPRKDNHIPVDNIPEGYEVSTPVHFPLLKKK